MKKRNMIKKMTAVILTVMAVAVMASAMLPSGAASAPEKLDYSNKSSTSVSELKASEFLKKLTGDALTTVEANYIDSVLGDVFMYSDNIPQKNVETLYDDNILHVYASKYSYVAGNGETVTWIPNNVTLGGKIAVLKYSAESDRYECTMTDIVESEGITLEVSYICNIRIDSEICDEYKNYAYNYAVELKNKKDNYDTKLDAYYDYQIYLGKLSAYNTSYDKWKKYIEDKAKYDKKYAEYLIYEAALADYQIKLSAYNEYKNGVAEFPAKLEAYKLYLEKKAVYDKEYKTYQTYVTEMQQALAKLDTLENVFVKNSEGKQMYATLMGDTVATVVNRKEELVNVGKCDPNDIDNAARSTDNLKKLLSSYSELNSPAQKFRFYQSNYSDIKNNFITLYGSLYSLYQNPAVVSALSNFGKLDRYIEFLSQLYVISTGLDDTQSRNPSWTIKGLYDMGSGSYKYYHYYDVLESVQLPEDKNNSDPSDITSLPTEVIQPVPPTIVEEPVMPTPVDEPIAPDVVVRPVEPTYVSEPKKPDYMADPGPKPDPIYLTEKQTSLIDALKKGELVKREEGKNETVVLDTILSKKVSLQNKCTVTFYNYDGKEILYTYEADKGSQIVFEGDTPTRQETEKYRYTFEGWKNDDGELVDLLEVDESTENFYASFKSELKKYKVIWKVDGVETEEEYEYGSLPSYNKTPEKEKDDQFTYVFAGWSTDISEVQGDAVYEAVFESVIRSYDVTWVVNGKEYTETYEYGAVPTFKQNTDRPEDEFYIYEFAGWDKTPSAVRGETTYTAVYNNIKIAEDSEGNTLKIETSDAGYSVDITFPDVNIGTLLGIAQKNDKPINISFANGTVKLILNSASVDGFVESGCVRIVIQRNTRSVLDTFTVRFLNAEGNDVELKYNVTIQTTCDGNANEDTRAYVKSADGSTESLAYTYENGVITVKLAKTSELVFRNEYKVTVGKCKNGVLTSDKTVSSAGEKISLALSFEDKYEILEVKVLGDLTGTEYEIAEDMTFIMPEEPVTVSAELKLREFTVKFVVDGIVISERVYHKGDAVELPVTPTKPDKDNKRYTFLNWSPAVTNVTEDVTYTAVFSEAILGGNDTYVPNSNNRFYMLIIEVVVILAVLIATPIVIVKLVKRKKAKKEKQEDPSNVPETSNFESEAAEGSENTQEPEKTEEQGNE